MQVVFGVWIVVQLIAALAPDRASAIPYVLADPRIDPMWGRPGQPTAPARAREADAELATSSPATEWVARYVEEVEASPPTLDDAAAFHFYAPYGLHPEYKGIRQSLLIRGAAAAALEEKARKVEPALVTELDSRFDALAAAAQAADSIVLPKTTNLTERPASYCRWIIEAALAAAIVRAANDSDAAITGLAEFTSVTGKGVTGRVEGKFVALGNAAMMAAHGVATSDMEGTAETFRQQGATALFVAVDGRAGGVIAIADPVKATARAAIDALKADGIHVVMLTGDNRTTAEAVARQLAQDDVHADVLPDDKHHIVRELKAAGKVVAMAGDGVNDAPALAEADVGIAMGTGTEVAIQSAGVTLVPGDLAGIVRARAQPGDHA